MMVLLSEPGYNRGENRAAALAKRSTLNMATAVIGTDRTFMKGRENGKQFERCPKIGNKYKRISESQKPGCTHGKYYHAGIAERPGDPKAWISGSSDLLRRAKERNVDVEGMVNYKAHDVPPPVSTPLADRLVNGLVGQIVAMDPGKKPKNKKALRALREQVIDKHAPHWHKKK